LDSSWSSSEHHSFAVQFAAALVDQARKHRKRPSEEIAKILETRRS